MPMAPIKFRPVDPIVWRACAGNSVSVPAVNSRAYYFPQGHALNSENKLSTVPEIESQPLILCRVIGVDYLTDTETHEILAKIQLLPMPLPTESSQFDDSVAVTQSQPPEFVSVVKVLTPSDANNGGGFSVPKSCADLIFPPLDFTADPPVQTLSVMDVVGEEWRFRHIYRGTPRRHLLTTGWGRFVNSKKLKAGDSAVFMKSRRSGQTYVGIRRAVKKTGEVAGCRRNYFEERESSSRPPKVNAVEGAMKLAARGVIFEVVYHPKVDGCDFVVNADNVERSANGVSWRVGSKVKMAVETEDSSKLSWMEGTVSTVKEGGSPWKMLQVTWDDHDALQNMTTVSPWQVEYVAPHKDSEAPVEAPPAKKCRISKNVQLEKDGEHVMGESSNAIEGHLNPSLSNSSFSASIQGSRQCEIDVLGLSNFIQDDTHHTDNYVVSNISPIVEDVSTELNIGITEASNAETFQFFGNKEVVVFSELNIDNAETSNQSNDPPKEFQFFGNKQEVVSIELNIGNIGTSNPSADPTEVFRFFDNEVFSTELNINSTDTSNPSADSSPEEFQFFGNEEAVVSTDMNIDNAEMSNPLVDPPEEFQFFGNEEVKTRVCTTSTNARSIQLFGRTIKM